MISRLLQGLLLVGLSLGASAGSLGNTFALDDVPIVQENPRAHTLADPGNFFVTGYWPRQHGGTLYRPLTMLRFAAQWRLGNGSPLAFHATNVLLYLLLTLAVWWLAGELLSPGGAWIAAALFAVHPVHVDAVGNVVGQSELVVALCLTLGGVIYLTARRRPGLGAPASLGLFGLMVAGALTKENGLVLPGLLLAAELSVVRDPRPLAVRLRALLPTAILLGVGAALVLWARFGALDTLVGETPVIALSHAGFRVRLLTMLGLVPEWVRLLLWPAHLQAEYGPPALDAATGFGLGQALGLGLLGGVVALAVRCRARHRVITFGVLWAAVAILPVSNLPIVSGVFLAERTLLVPSVGVVLVAGALAPLLWERLVVRPMLRAPALACLGAVLGLGVVRSATREPVWKDSATLFTQGIVDAPDTYRSWLQYGKYLGTSGRLTEARQAFERAAGLYDRDSGVYEELGQIVRMQSGCRAAIPIFERAIALEPYRKDSRGRLHSCLMSVGDTARAVAVAEKGAELGEAYFQLQLIKHRMEASAAPRPAQ